MLAGRLGRARYIEVETAPARSVRRELVDYPNGSNPFPHRAEARITSHTMVSNVHCDASVHMRFARKGVTSVAADAFTNKN